MDRCGAKQVMKFGNSEKSVLVDEESSGIVLLNMMGTRFVGNFPIFMLSVTCTQRKRVEYNVSAISLFLLVLVFIHSFYSVLDF